ncbi:hypothetical protein [Yinghuangia seranimata]|uniref:hypothetical protein n=1 Tax=Yinghuangia seranimata TaxID=408067 RepID=UPI00248BCF0E|nr:hypothetical protein [Yinghuangia seranimata]MDI2125027.1 hypothetical protein [Yinghuangia seranimata]
MDGGHELVDPGLTSYAGTAPTAKPKPGAGGGTTAPGFTTVHGVCVRSAASPALVVSKELSADPAGVKNYAADLKLAPATAAAPQQLRVQTSLAVKLIQPWGLPQR